MSHKGGVLLAQWSQARRATQLQNPGQESSQGPFITGHFPLSFHTLPIELIKWQK